MQKIKKKILDSSILEQLGDKSKYTVGSIEYQVIELVSTIKCLQLHVESHKKDYAPIHKLKMLKKKLDRFKNYLSKKSVKQQSKKV